MKLIQSCNSTEIVIKFDDSILYTKDLPLLKFILDQYLPGIYQHRCFNNMNIPFYKEVLKTEIGHLYEHVLLEYLTLISKQLQGVQISFSGNTVWDWNKDERGVFHIYINITQNEHSLLKRAIENANFLMTYIFTSSYFGYNFQHFLSQTEGFKPRVMIPTVSEDRIFNR